MSRVIVQFGDDEKRRLYIKGAPEILLPDMKINPVHKNMIFNNI